MGKMSVCGPGPRDRIVGTARSLFHRLGIRGVGVDKIAEEAGTNKMTLYRHFDSKDGLIVECLRSAAAEMRKMFAEIEAAHPGDASAQLNGWIAMATRDLASDIRGCPLTNASVELADAGHPAHQVIEEFKAEHRTWLRKICAEAGVSDPDMLANTLTMLLEGARVARQSEGDQQPSVNFAAMASAVVSSFGKKPGSRSASVA
ncbi:MAG TPA: TetR/AcrR family transcriptional regulator [Rhizomicrobium sp.]